MASFCGPKQTGSRVNVSLIVAISKRVTVVLTGCMNLAVRNLVLSELLSYLAREVELKFCLILNFLFSSRCIH